ncbi:penicillin-binding protein 1C [Acidiphilium sp. AL]|uniref:penicillin-binding protein 1C n=1 Tax=Acidiphilium sp. AL TaxID=2871704 RepID=UPI0021CB73C3|nr:penicillin-binding protein 1C [Acidiphilium sp. AL]
MPRPMVARRIPDPLTRWTTAAIVTVAIVFGAAWLFPPNLARLHDRSRVVFGRHFHPIATFEDRRGEWKLPTTEAEVDPLLPRMLIASEDRHFYLDPGVNPFSILRATVQMLAAGHVVSGASTLTMQVARLLHPAPRTLKVKIGEAFHAIALNEHDGKAEILGMWLSLAPFGGNIVGVEAASRAWFGHSPATLSPAEAALLVALCRRPAALDPAVHPRAALTARNRILLEAASLGVISRAALIHAEATPVPRRRHRFLTLSPQITDHLPDRARTTIDGALDTAIARFARGQLRRLAPTESLAIIVADAKTRAIRAIYAGDWTDPRRAGFLDLTRTIRSPGSALKPFLYGLAFADGLARPSTLLTDLPRDFGGYAPDDYTGAFKGDVTAATALRRSLNLPAVALMRRFGPAKFAAHLASAGAPLALPRGVAPTLPLALGGAGITMRRLVALYAALATDGTVEPLHLIAGQRRNRRRLISPAIARSITGILTRPFPGGGPAGIAWKTGTSAGNRDNWAIGYDRRYVAGVWIGEPDGGALPNQSALAALPVLADVFGFLKPAPLPMRRAHPPVTLVSAARPKLALLFPPPKAILPVGPPVHLRAMGGDRPLNFMIDDRLLPSIPALRSADWQPPGPGFYHLTILDAKGDAITRTLRVGNPRLTRPATAPASAAAG